MSLIYFNIDKGDDDSPVVEGYYCAPSLLHLQNARFIKFEQKFIRTLYSFV